MTAPIAAGPRRVWYRRPPSQTALLTVPFILIVVWTIGIAGVAGSVRIALILVAIELSLGAVMLAALSPLIMLRTDEIRIWHGFRFINIGMSEIAGIGMLYATPLAMAVTGGSSSGEMTDRWNGQNSRTCSAGARALHRGKDDGIGPARRTTTRLLPARSQP